MSIIIGSPSFPAPTMVTLVFWDYAILAVAPMPFQRRNGSLIPLATMFWKSEIPLGKIA